MPEAAENQQAQPQRRGLLLICYVGFVSLGLPDAVIGVAWPSIRRAFDLEQSAISWIFLGGGCSYFLSSFFAGRLLKLWSVGTLLAGSSALVALSAFNYSAAQIWPLFALGSLLHGLGSGARDSGLNHFVASHFAARHMNWLHASYSLGAMLGPALMTSMIARAESWRSGYLIVAIALTTLSVLFVATRHQWKDSHGQPSATPSLKPVESVRLSLVFQNPGVWLHIFLFFVYTGLEVALGQWSYTVLTESRQIPATSAGTWVTIYWASILAGRILFGFIVDRLNIDTLIRFSTLLAVAGAALFTWEPFPYASPLALGLGGMGLAVIFPCLMTRTPQRFGQDIAAHAIGFQVGAAMLGAAALPSLLGVAAQNLGLRVVPGLIFLLATVLLLLHEGVLAWGRKQAAVA